MFLVVNSAFDHAGNSLKTARLEHDLGIPASYYFRAVPESWEEAGVRLGLLAY